jgi:hypothetical protein
VPEAKGRICPTTGRKGPEGEYRHTSTLSLTSALDGGGWVNHPPPSSALAALPSEKRGWVCARTGAESLAPTGI